MILSHSQGSAIVGAQVWVMDICSPPKNGLRKFYSKERTHWNITKVKFEIFTRPSAAKGVIVLQTLFNFPLFSPYFIFELGRIYKFVSSPNEFVFGTSMKMSRFSIQKYPPAIAILHKHTTINLDPEIFHTVYPWLFEILEITHIVDNDLHTISPLLYSSFLTLPPGTQNTHRVLFSHQPY